MKRFTIPCDFGGQKAPFHIYVGEPDPTKHPLLNQSNWLSNERSGSIPSEVMESFEKLHAIAKENNVSFEDLCVYALGAASDGDAASSGSGGSWAQNTGKQGAIGASAETAINTSAGVKATNG